MNRFTIRINIILIADFNINLVRESSPWTDNFISTLGSFFYQPHILQPTIINDHTANLIDNIFFNSIEHFAVSGNKIYKLTYHLPNFILVTKSSVPNTIKIYKGIILTLVNQLGLMKFNQWTDGQC